MASSTDCSFYIPTVRPFFMYFLKAIFFLKHPWKWTQCKTITVTATEVLLTSKHAFTFFPSICSHARERYFPWDFLGFFHSFPQNRSTRQTGRKWRKIKCKLFRATSSQSKPAGTHNAIPRVLFPHWEISRFDGTIAITREMGRYFRSGTWNIRGNDGVECRPLFFPYSPFTLLCFLHLNVHATVCIYSIWLGGLFCTYAWFFRGLHKVQRLHDHPFHHDIHSVVYYNRTALGVRRYKRIISMWEFNSGGKVLLIRNWGLGDYHVYLVKGDL